MLITLASMLACFALAVLPHTPRQDAAPHVDVARVPAGGVQPEVAVDADGVLHMVYLAGDPKASNVFYVRSTDHGRTFSTPIRVNSQDGSAIAAGTIRGASLAVGRGGRIHVAWNGSGTALPKGLPNPATSQPGMPMLYSRSDATGTRFEPQRNLMTRTTNLDGGGSIAADSDGRVFVAWHGNDAKGPGNEASRRVWLARSIDDGKTFEPEEAVFEAGTGACGCCALRLVRTGSELRLLYRAATEQIHRDVFALVSRDHGRHFTGARLHPWEIGACPMTSMDVSTGPTPIAAWETDGNVYMKRLDEAEAPVRSTGPLTDPAARRKYPRIAVSPEGTTLLVWTEGASHGQAGSVAWQAYHAEGRPVGPRGSRADLPKGSLAAVVGWPQGGFSVIY